MDPFTVGTTITPPPLLLSLFLSTVGCIAQAELFHSTPLTALPVGAPSRSIFEKSKSIEFLQVHFYDLICI
jgi:hypothetical protein